LLPSNGHLTGQATRPFPNRVCSSLDDCRDRSGAGELRLIHDRSSALKREQDVWETILDPGVRPALVGQDRRTIQFPLNVREIQLAESTEHPSLQIADLLAEAAVTYFRNRYNFEPGFDTNTRPVSTTLASSTSLATSCGQQRLFAWRSWVHERSDRRLSPFIAGVLASAEK
jgi:hypothetical protein